MVYEWGPNILEKRVHDSVLGITKESKSPLVNVGGKKRSVMGHRAGA